MSRFIKATRKRSKLRMAIDGPSGSGKSFTMLRLAVAMAHATGGRVAAIDTEHGSLCKYQGEAPDGIPFDFDVLELSTFAPTEYTSAIVDASRAGYACLVIDSLSHAWTGEGGALDLKDKSGDKSSFSAWKNITPMHNRMIEAIISAPLHVFASMRTKTEYILETNAEGKTSPRKVGMAPIQRSGMEYEFDVYASIDLAHIMTVSKSRCSEIQDLIMPKPGAALADTLLRWLDTGDAGEGPAGAIRRLVASDEAVARLAALTVQLEMLPAKLNEHLAKQYGVDAISQLTETQAGELEAKLTRDLAAAKRVAERRAAAAGAATQQTTQTTVQTPTPAVAPVVAAPALTAPADDAAERTALLTKLLELRATLWAAKGIENEDDQLEEWHRVLGVAGVTSARDMDTETLRDFVQALGERYDPFAFGTGKEEPAPT
jgi:energy-coupling factor transporter ATP-binding protein EcfA2